MTFVVLVGALSFALGASAGYLISLRVFTARRRRTEPETRPEPRTKSNAGQWWLPTRADEKRGGSLVIDDRDVVTLYLDGSFYRVREVAVRHISEPVIVGILDDGTPVTLFEPYNGVINFFGQQYYARHAFIGAHVDADEALRAVRFSGTELDNFLRAPAGVNIDSAPLGVRHVAVFRGHHIQFSVDRSDEIALVDDQPRSSITIFDLLNWNQAWEMISALSLLLTLLASKENAVLNVTVTTDNGVARVVTSTRTVAHARAADRRPSSLVATVNDIADLDALLARFDEFQTAVPNVLGPFVSYLRDPGDVTASASRIAQTLESYQRDRLNADGKKRYLQQQIEPDLFAAVQRDYRKMLETFPKEASKVQLQNHRALRERIVDLYREHHELLDEITDEKTLADDAKKNRNSFSHATSESGEISRDEVESIFWAGERMRMLFDAILLVELGVDRRTAYELLRSTDRFDMLRLRARA